METQAELVLDARAAGRFTGEVPEPRAGMRSGHIPGSASLPYTDLLNADGTFRPVAEAMRARFAQAGVDGSRPVVTSCGSGVTACILTLGLRLAGLPEGAVYDGSWTEWGGRADTPVETQPRMTDTPKRGFRTRLSHTGRAGKRVHGFVNPPLLRGSTVLTPTVAERRALQAKRGERVLTYGLGGSADALGAGGRDRRGRRRHALRHRVFRPRGGDHAAAGVPEGRRSLPDAGQRLRPVAQLLRGRAASASAWRPHSTIR